MSDDRTDNQTCNMGRLIDADKLIMLLADWQLYESPQDTDDQAKREKQRIVWSAIEKAIQATQEQPTIDAEPVQHGKWLIDEYEYYTYECSECGRSYYHGCDTYTEAKWRLGRGLAYAYCPHCGAKMDLNKKPPETFSRGNDEESGDE